MNEKLRAEIETIVRDARRTERQAAEEILAAFLDRLKALGSYQTPAGPYLYWQDVLDLFEAR